MKRKRKSRTPVRTTYVTSHPEVDSDVEILVPDVQVEPLLADSDQEHRAIISINGRDVEDVPSTAFPATRTRAA